MSTKTTRLPVAGHDAHGLPYSWNDMGTPFYPTPCCGATGKGSDSPTGVVCRACYATVGAEYGDGPELPCTEGDIAFVRDLNADRNSVDYWIGHVGTVTAVHRDGTVTFVARGTGAESRVPAREARLHQRPSMNKVA